MDTRQSSTTKKGNIAQLLGRTCKSTESRVKYRVCFRNLSENDASIYWIDFKGKPVFYGFIKTAKASEAGLDIDTFITHPWVAVDRRKKQLLAINFSLVLRPITMRDFLNEKIKINRFRVIPQNQETTNDEQNAEGAQPEEGQHLDAFITEAVLKLELSCCLKVCKIFTQSEIKELEIPKHMKEKLANVFESWLLLSEADG